MINGKDEIAIARRGRRKMTDEKGKNATLSDIKELKKAIADMIKYIPQPFCPLLNHSKKDRHELFDPCPLEERIKLKIKQWKELAK